MSLLDEFIVDYLRHREQQAIYQTLAVDLKEGKGTMSGYAFPFDSQESGVIRHVSHPLTHSIVVIPHPFQGRIRRAL